MLPWTDGLVTWQTECSPLQHMYLGGSWFVLYNCVCNCCSMLSSFVLANVAGVCMLYASKARRLVHSMVRMRQATQKIPEAEEL